MGYNMFIKCHKSEKMESGSHYGQFSINSLKSGQGVTIGNQLRRILLNDLEGIAISAVRFEGISDEFSIIPGVQEDILEILLNLKGIVLKGNIETPQFGRLKITGPTVINAGLIQLPPDLKIVNPNHYILTLSTSNILEIEFKIEFGTGYKLAMQSFKNADESFLQLDSIYMPVQKVNFKIENIYNNTNEIAERIIIDIWTNGSISPDKALISAIEINIDLFTSLIGKNLSSRLKKQRYKVKSYKNMAIEELKLSMRAYNCLKKTQINTIGDLLTYSPAGLRKLKNFGKKSSEEVFLKLKNRIGILFT